MFLVDTNVILRYLLADISELHERAKDLIENHDIYIRTEVFVELIFVLTKVYKIPKEETVKVLKNLLSYENIKCESKELLFLALDFYKTQNLHIVDCILCALKKLYNKEVYSFDRGLLKCLNNQ